MHPLEAGREVAKRCDAIDYSDKVAWTYDPFDYAWDGYRQYVEKLGEGPRQALFVGMNPGPWGMGQTGVPFGDPDQVCAMGVTEIDVTEPTDYRSDERPVHGLDSPRNEVSGTRLFEGLARVFGSLPDAYQHLFVANYCPLLFFDDTGSNLTPPKLLKADREPLFAACDEHLDRLVNYYDPDALVGVGRFAERRIEAVLDDRDEDRTVEYLLHPSPANPHANRDGGQYWQDQLDELVDTLGLLGG